jgi:hypothetical protein
MNRSLFPLLVVVSIIQFLVGCTLMTRGSSTADVISEPPDDALIVKSNLDSGPGSFRQAITNALEGDTIIFDPNVFPPDTPETILLATELPGMDQGGVTIDASNAGVILDGRELASNPAYGLQVFSDGNTIMGLQIMNFNEGGIVVAGVGRYNRIGGDREVGEGPTGQANLIICNNIGIGLWNETVSNNLVIGNWIGGDPNGEIHCGNQIGIILSSGAHHNILGPENTIARNEVGIVIANSNTQNNTITQNAFISNVVEDIRFEDGGNKEMHAPVITTYQQGVPEVGGYTCPECVVELYTHSGTKERRFVDRTTADAAGIFQIILDTGDDHPSLSAIATTMEGNTSQFSVPTQDPMIIDGLITDCRHPYGSLVGIPDAEVRYESLVVSTKEDGSFRIVIPSLDPEIRIEITAEGYLSYSESPTRMVAGAFHLIPEDLGRGMYLLLWRSRLNNPNNWHRKWDVQTEFVIVRSNASDDQIETILEVLSTDRYSDMTGGRFTSNIPVSFIDSKPMGSARDGKTVISFAPGVVPGGRAQSRDRDGLIYYAEITWDVDQVMDANIIWHEMVHTITTGGHINEWPSVVSEVESLHGNLSVMDIELFNCIYNSPPRRDQPVGLP